MTCKSSTRFSLITNAIDNDFAQDKEIASLYNIIIALISSLLLTLFFSAALPFFIIVDLIGFSFNSKQSDAKPSLLCFCAHHEDELVLAALGDKQQVELFHFKAFNSLLRFVASLPPFTTSAYFILLRILYRSILYSFKYRQYKYFIRSLVAFELVPLSFFAENSCCTTTDHYQRYFYILSHLSRSLSVIQHGFINESLTLPHSIHSSPSLKSVYVRAGEFVQPFSKLYQLQPENCTIFTYARALEPCTQLPQSICLFSWSLKVSQELKLLHSIMKLSRKSSYFKNLKIIIMLHPAHNYAKHKLSSHSFQFTVLHPKNKSLPIPNCSLYLTYRTSFINFELPNRSTVLYANEVTPSQVLKALMRH
jgi:hypothetical protein